MEKPGPYHVGLKVEHQYDRSRPFPALAPEPAQSPKQDGRPLQTLVWYPAQPDARKPMSVGDYAKLADTETYFNAPRPDENRWRMQLKDTWDAPLWAVRDAKAAEGRYPVLIYAPSDSSVAWENADLCEYLASHGYVVLATPSMGASTRDMTDDLEGINAQAGDISFLATFAGTLPHADSSRIAALSWSWGGLSSLFAAARDPRIAALAQMDSSLRYFPGLVQQAADVHPDRMTIPLIFFAEGDASLPERLDAYYDGPPGDILGHNVLNAWKHGDLFTAFMLGMSHGEFGAMIQRRKSAQSFAEDQVADYGREDANIGYAWVARYTLNFLDSYLKHDAAAAAFLRRTPAENGVPKHFMGIRFRARLPIPASPPASG